ncbi:MAG: hypothetical protein L0Y56_15770, partial [Nitrospira sp.]|nr:hypothetical protein [Nitrospira sp.]
CTEFILHRLLNDNRLLSTYKDGVAKLNGYLDDYAFFIGALLDLHEATFEKSYLEWANQFAQTMVEQFWDDGVGGFFFTGKDHEALITRTKSGYDHSIPSGNAVGAMDLLRLYYLTDHNDYLAKAEQALRLFYQSMQENPFGYASMLAALDFYLERPKEIVLVGQRDAQESQDLLKKIHSLYLPNKILFFMNPDRTGTGKIPSLVKGKTQQNGKLTVYVCHNFTCSLPVTEWGVLKDLLLAK